MEIMVTSFKRSHVCTATLMGPNPAAGHLCPCLCFRLLDTPGQVWVSLLWGHCSFLLGPGTQGSVCALQEYFPVLFKFEQLYGGVNGDLLQEGLCHTQVCCTQSPWPCGQTAPYLHRICSNTVCLSGVPGPWCTHGLFEPSEHLWWEWGLILNMNEVVILIM